MIKEFIFSVVGIAFLETACEMIIPEGNMKKYFKLAMGFIMMCVLLKPVTELTDFKKFEFSFDENLTEAELRAESDAYILKIHEDNIRKKILEICGENTQVFIELYSDGNIKSIALRGNVSDSNIMYLKEELGCENITVARGEYDEE